MKFLYQFHVRNEQEIRNDSPSRSYYVAADSMFDAVRGYEVVGSLLESVEFVSPVVVVDPISSSSQSPVDKSLDSLESQEPVVDNSCSLCHIIYIDNDNRKCGILVHAVDTFSAVSRLQTYLGYSPVIDRSYMIDEPII